MSQISPLTPVVQVKSPNTSIDTTGRLLRVGPFVNIASILRSLGYEPEPVFRRVGFDLEQFTDPDFKLPYRQVSRLLAACAEESGCGHFGLLVGQSASASHLGLAGFLMRAAPTVETALDTLVAHLDLHDEGGTPNVIKSPEMTLFGYTIHQPGVAAIEQVYDLATAVTCNIMRAFCGKTWRPDQVMLSRRKPADTDPYRRFFNAPIQFDAELSAIAFRTRTLHQPVASADPLLFSHLEKTASKLHSLKNQDFAESLSVQLRQGLLQHKCSAQEIANNLGLHERTLHRRLRAAGTSYRQELDKVRWSTSLQLLEGTDMSVAQIADSLGYASSSAFIRAFCRWTGTTPLEWRRARGSGRLGNGA